MRVLLTGGTGYIGSHTAVELLAAGHDVVLLDNLENSSARAVSAIRAVSGRQVSFIRGDIRDGNSLDGVFRTHAVDAVIHLAALKAVGESVAKPEAYHDTNVAGSRRLVERMAANGVTTLVFSSTAAVYGDPAATPITEDCPASPQSPYARTKREVEELLWDLHRGDPRWRISILRYFNAVGAHPSGQLGEDPRGVPDNLLPYIAQVAAGRLERLDVFGDDYPTRDGTGIRDYLHVVDLARGHLAALDYIRRSPGVALHNLGTGRGHTVLEVLHAFEAASERTIPYRITARRPGDIAMSCADVSRAREELDWNATHDLRKICEDLWLWQSSHPDGYGDDHSPTSTLGVSGNDSASSQRAKRMPSS